MPAAAGGGSPDRVSMRSMRLRNFSCDAKRSARAPSSALPSCSSNEIVFDGGTPSSLRIRRSEDTIALSHSMSARSEEHTSELQSLMRIFYAVFCLKKKKQKNST